MAKQRKISFFYLLLFCFSNTSFSVLAETLKHDAEKTITFNEGITKLLKKNSEILKSNAVLISFESNIDRANNLRIPTVNITTFIAPAYETTGDAFESKDNYNKWGPAYYGEIMVTMPVFTFNSIYHAQEAAEKGYQAGKFLRESEINKQLYEYKKIYLGQVLLYKLENLMIEADSKMEEILETATERYISGDSTIMRKDMARLKIYSIELKTLKQQIAMEKKNSQRALGHFMGEKISYAVSETEFPDNQIDDQSINSWLAQTSGNPDYRAAVLGLEAYRHSYQLEKKKALPVIFLGVQGSYSRTPVREDQQSIYARDPYNTTTGAAVIGARWNFDWSQYKSSEKKAYAELEKAKEQRKQAQTGIPLKIAMAYNKVVYQYSKWKNDQKKYKEASKWFMSEYSAFATGTGKAEDLMEALAVYYLSEKLIYESEYQYLLSIALLMKEAGNQSTLKKWGGE